MKKGFFSQLYKDFGTSGIVFAAVLVLLLGGLGGVVVERFVLPYFSTWPIIRHFSLLQPDTPILITQRDEVRIEDGVNRTEVVNKVKNSLVNLYLHQGDFDSGNFRVEDSFTGVIVSNDGLILTPAVNLEQGFLVNAVLPKGVSEKAEVVASDNLTGLAILKVDSESLAVLRQGFSENLQVGEGLLAVWIDEDTSRPRSVRVESTGPALVKPSLKEVYDLRDLNTSVEVLWPGSEPVTGALIVNREGEMIGIESVVSGERMTVRGEDVKMLLDNFLGDQEVNWPTLNLEYQFFVKDQSLIFELPEETGVLIKSRIQQLRADDFVFAVNGSKITEREGFQELLLSKQPGSLVKMRLIRDGQDAEVNIGL